MPNKQIVTLDTGNVLVIRFLSSGAEQREYCEPGDGYVYLLQDIPCLPKWIQVAPHGEPLKVRHGEELEDAIRRMLDEEDCREKPKEKRSCLGLIVILGWAAAVAAGFWAVR